MLNLILIINFFFCFDWKYPEFNSHVYLPCFGQIITFSEEFGSKNENWLFQLESDTLTYWNMLNSKAKFNFSLFTGNISFWVNLIWKLWLFFYFWLWRATFTKKTGCKESCFRVVNIKNFKYFYSTW